MRIGAFMLGGIIGAAAVVYFTRNQKMMTMSSMNQQAGQMVNSTFGMMKDKVQDTAMKAMDMALNRQSKQDDGLQQIEQIVNQDPELKKQVDEIINSSDQQH